MAMINLNHFEKKIKDRNQIQEKVNASYSVFTVHGEKYFQIDTYGTLNRKILNKTSQTLQFDKESAIKIIELLRKEYNI